ncbi:MAG: sigma 54-interacting transcriptional regulator, partial [Planctomycetota bacterium]
KSTPPPDLIAEALDSQNVLIRDTYALVKLHDGRLQRIETMVLMLQVDDQQAVGQRFDQHAIQAIRGMAELLMPAMIMATDGRYCKVRFNQMRAMMIASRVWQTQTDTDTLLHSIADTAAQMLGAQRASIFLWKKRSKSLVGRPALGVENNELIVPDDQGVVGDVLHTGQPKTWHASEDSVSEVNKSIDEKLKFETRSLVAVPLRTPPKKSGDEGRLLGVFEVLNKTDGRFTSLDVDALTELSTYAALAIHNVEDRKRLMDSRDRLLSDATESSEIIGDSPGMMGVKSSIERIAPTDMAIVILGENGTGKEVVARRIHMLSSRRSEPFVAVNCAALVESLLESELFGHEKGAFTDAVTSRPGKFELAGGGTLFLDEIGDMSATGQAKLLRVLEDGVVVRVGGSQPIPTDVRVLAATNQPIQRMVAEGTFREDLWYRLNV